MVKNLPTNVGDLGLILGQEDALDKEIATHSRLSPWEILWTEETGGLRSMTVESDIT